MRLWARLILVLYYVAFLDGLNQIGWGRPWMRMLASALVTGVIVIHMSERRISSRTAEHTTLNIQR